MSLTVVDRYVLREILQTWGAVTAVLLLILVANSLAYMLGRVVDGELAADIVIPLFLTTVTGYIMTLVPVGLYLGILLSFGRMYAESEMSALGACGIGLARLYRPVFIAAAIGTVITAVLTMWLSPWANRVEHDIKAQAAARSDLAGIVAGRFNRTADGHVVIFAERRDEEEGRLEEVFVEARDPDGTTHLVRARGAVERVDPETGSRFLEFRDGERYTGTPGSPEFRVVEFVRHGIRVPEHSVTAGQLDLEARTLQDLWQVGTPATIAQVQWRISLPLVCLVLAFAAPPLSQTSPRKGRYGKIGIALLIYLVYVNVLVAARKAVADETVSTAIGMWWVQIVSVALVFGLIVKRQGWRWTRAVLTRRWRDAL